MGRLPHIGRVVALALLIGSVPAVAGCNGGGTSPTAPTSATVAAPATSAPETRAPASSAPRNTPRSPRPTRTRRTPTVAPSRVARTTRPGKPSVALSQLAALPVKGRAPKTGYTREQFGPAWTDDVSVAGGHNGCDTRNDILARDLTAITFKPGSNDCAVLTGTLHDPYTGRVISFHRGVGSSNAVQIDHVVALSDAWQTGAQQLTADQRRNFANDPLNLQAVDGPTNESKGAGDAATWLPPNKAYRCTYVSRQVAVKTKYRLWVTPAEHDAIARILGRCDKTAGLTVVPVPRRTTPSPTSTHAPEPAAPPAPPKTNPLPSGCTPLSNGGHCYRIGELCAERYRGTTGVTADGEPMVCRDVNGWRWEPR